jgi:glycosyltransferase involved in cell wall biosynthesis
VTVIVPVLNEMRYLPSCLDGLLAGDFPADQMEVLVVDGGSTDGTREYVGRRSATDERLRLLDNPARTAPAALNIGIRAARGGIVVRMDGHAIPAADYVSSCVAALERTGADMVGGMMVGQGETPLGEAVALATSTPLGAGDAGYRLGGEGPTDTVYLGAWWTSVLDRLGGFDEDLARNQDYELCVRIREAGGTVWLDPSIRSVTLVRPTLVALARQYFGYGRGRAATFRKHPRSLRLRQVLPAAFSAVAFLGLPIAITVRPLRRAVAVAVGLYAGAVAVASVVLARRHGDRHLRRLPLAFATMHLAWGLGFWRGLIGSRSRHHGRRRSSDGR